MTKEIVSTNEKSPNELIQMALSSGADLDKLKQLLDLQKEWESNEAKKSFNTAMSVVHSNIPAVCKSKKNNQTNSKYAELDEIIIKTKSVYTNEGFSVSFYEGDGAPAEHVRVCIDIQHRQGHSQTRYYDVPLDGFGIKGNANMTKIHAKASSVSYGRRYLLCMIFNIPTNDDNDGNNGSFAGAQEVLNDSQLNEITNYLDNYGVDQVKFLKYVSSITKTEINAVEGIPASKFDILIKMLKQKTEKATQKTKGGK